MSAEVYKPRGGAAKMTACQDPAILIDGPVFTGKTFAVLWKCLIVADQFPGARILLARKTRKSLSESVLVTFEERILRPGLPITMHGGDRSRRTHYTHENGSVIVVGGMDPGGEVNGRLSIMSTEWDLAALLEATEFTEDDAQKIRTRLRNGVVPYQQLIMDCNPGAPTHWLIQGANKGIYTRCPSRHEDNPRMWDEEKGEWTSEGKRYMAVLDQLSGHRRLRLRDGKWASAEGAVYPDWDSSVHLIDRFDVPPEWRRVRAIDFGYTNSFVCQWWAIDGDGRAFMYREIYRPGILVEDHAAEIVRLSQGEKIEATVADHDAEDRATLEKHGVYTIKATKDVATGIQAVAARLRRAGDGRPRLFIMRDSLTHAPDPALVEAKKPVCTAAEVDGYAWAKVREGRSADEEPVKVDDHGCDAKRYLVQYLDGGVQVGLSFVYPGRAREEQRKAAEERARQETAPEYFARRRSESLDFGFRRSLGRPPGRWPT